MAGAGRLSDSWRSLRQVATNPDLWRLELAWAAVNAGSWAFVVTLSVFAYEADGARAVGIVGFVRILPSALLAPVAGVLADRLERARAMVFADLARAVLAALAALAVWVEAPAVTVYALAALLALASTVFQPVQCALVPALAREPSELAAANAASSLIESVTILAAPALGGFLLAATGAGWVFATTAATFVISALLVSRIATASRPSADASRESMTAAILLGFRAILRDRRLRLLVGLFSAQTLVRGCMNVLVVVMALELLRMGTAGVGLLNSAIGVGGLVGVVAVLALSTRARLASEFRLGIVLWGAPIALIGIRPSTATALVLLAVVGLGNALVDVTGFTLLQRAVPDDDLARVFGVLESAILGSIAVGSLVAPALIAALDVRLALVAIGLFLPALVLVLWRPLTRIDVEAPAPVDRLALLRALPLFAPLPASTLETLAWDLVPTHAHPGERIVQQGEEGDCFYVIERGRVSVDVDDHRVAALGPGDCFGEIALLRDDPRMATVTALEDADLYALGRDEFVAAVAGYAQSARAADALVSARLAQTRRTVGSI